MAVDRIPEQKSVHQKAFEHYLRTGQRLTNAEWLALHERKFNPYHDEIGRFTSPPGVTVSWGRSGGLAHHSESTGRARQTGDRRSPITGSNGSYGGASSQSPKEIQRDLVKRSLGPPAPVTSRLDLRVRRDALERLRHEAGSNPDPIVKADLEELGRRLDAAEVRLAEAERIADRQVAEILRAGLPPIDTAASALNILSGEGDLGDALNVASSIPLASPLKLVKLSRTGRVVADAAAGPAGKIVQRGGAFRDIKIKDLLAYDRHHTPGKAISPLSEADGPAIAMLREDHQKLISSRGGAAAKAFREKQRVLIEQGNFEAAIKMDIDDIRDKCGGKYDEAIDQMLEYSRSKGYIK